MVVSVNCVREQQSQYNAVPLTNRSRRKSAHAGTMFIDRTVAS